MKIFKDYTFKWYDAGILKWTTFLLGIYIGATWPTFFEGWTNLLLALGIMGVIYLFARYWKEIF